MSNFDFKNIFRRETKLASYIIICLTIVVISLSYAMFFQVDENTVNQEVVAGNLTFTYSEGNVISSMQRVCFEPMSDDEASLFMSSCGYEFSVTNTGTLKASYTLKLLANEENVASKENLKIILRKRVGDTYEVVDGYPKMVSDLIDGVLLTSELNEKETLVYLAQIYVDESTYHDNHGEIISYKIEGSGMVHEDESIGIDTNNMMRERNVLFEDGNVIKDGFEDDSNIWDHLRSATKIIFKNKIDNLDDVHSVVDMSYSKNNSVVMYFDSSGEDLIIAANGNIKLPPDSSYYFYNLDVNEIIGLEYVDTSNVTNMSHMFDSTLGLTSLDLSHFDTSKVTNMSGMFYRLRGLTHLDLSHFNTSHVIDMSYMFEEMSRTISLDLSSFDTSNVQDMSHMFFNMNKLISLNLSSIDTSNVMDMSAMFYDMGSLTNLDLSNFDTSNVTNISDMFYGMSSLTSLDISHFNTSKVTNMNSMFAGVSKLTNLDLSYFDTSNVRDMSAMFAGMSGITSLDLSHFDTSKVTDMSAMFEFSSNLTTITYGPKFVYKNNASVKNMFDECPGNLPTDVSWEGVLYRSKT